MKEIALVDCVCSGNGKVNAHIRLSRNGKMQLFKMYVPITDMYRVVGEESEE